jgi:hypothetical protein
MMKFTSPPGLSTATRMFGSVIWSSDVMALVSPARCSVLSTWTGQNTLMSCPSWMTCRTWVRPPDMTSASPEIRTCIAVPSSSNSVSWLPSGRPNWSPNSSKAWNCPT